MRTWITYGIGLILVIQACKQPEPQIVAEQTPTEAIGTVNKDSIAPPVVKPLKAPRKIAAPKPMRVPLKYPYGVGKPVIVNYTMADGLAQSVSFDVETDDQGNLWVAGFDGLSKFDGTHFTSYKTANGLGLGIIQWLLMDSSQIWVGGLDGLSRFDVQAFHPTAYDRVKKREEGILGIYKDKHAAIWMAHRNGIHLLRGDSITHFGEADGLPKGPVFELNEDKNGHLVVSTRSGLFYRQDDRFVPYGTSGIFRKRIRISGKDRQGNLWFSYRLGKSDIEGLLKYDGNLVQEFTTINGLPESRFIYRIMEDRNGMIWIATSEGLVRFDGERFITYTTRDGLSSDNIYSLAEDNAGNIWIATKNGVSRLSYNYLNPLEVLPDGASAESMAITKGGAKWVLSNRSGKYYLVKYQKDEALIYDLNGLEPAAFFGAQIFIQPARDGSLWMNSMNISSPVKFCRFDGNSFFLYGIEQGVDDAVGEIFEDKDGVLWIYERGLDRLIRMDAQTISYYGAAQGFPTDAYTRFRDSKGRLWISGIEDSSLYQFDGHYVTRYTKKDGYSTNNTVDMAEDLEGNIWFATRDGLTRYDGKAFTHVGPIEGIDKTVSSITIDTGRNLLWICSIDRLFNLDLDQLSKHSIVQQRFDQRNGFDISGAYVNYARVYLDSIGLWSWTTNGVFRLNYDAVRQIKRPELVIRNIRVDNKEVLWSALQKEKIKDTDSLMLLNESVMKTGKPWDAAEKAKQDSSFGSIRFDGFKPFGFIPQNLQLPYSNNSITIEFALVSPSFGKHTQYRYMLEGYTDDWSPLSSRDEVFFGNMKEGDYTFRLQAISATGAQSELSYSFIVLPPWWRTWWAYSLYAICFFTALFAFIRWRTRALQLEKKVLEEKVASRTTELNQSLEHLKATQSQLIQAEKMASLGELTAGIAHEIQNPLNFVNNFSEVSGELVDEMNEELDKGDIEEAKIIGKDLKENLSKINHHGKRADAIVKGMLEHSRAGKGEKAPTDINALADEYLRLSYHGLRAKDKSFSTDFATDLDPNLPKVNVVASDIGRVLLNLINNAFYAVNERSKKGEEGYCPKVLISSRQENGKVVVSVQDNGPGIPDSIKSKIFQPFFTTKPTGQGTGLGLSLSYDIVKAHGGELKVETKIGEGTTFIIDLEKKA